MNDFIVCEVDQAVDDTQTDDCRSSRLCLQAATTRTQRIELRGFGSFSVRQQESLIGRNPRTGANVDVPAKAVPHFKTRRVLFDRLNDALQ